MPSMVTFTSVIWPLLPETVRVAGYKLAGPEVPVPGIAMSKGPVSIESDHPPSMSPVSLLPKSATKRLQVPFACSLLKSLRLTP